MATASSLAPVSCLETPVRRPNPDGLPLFFFWHEAEFFFCWTRTDTRHYWKLTEHIFRYSHHYTGNRTWVAGGAHTVNEGEFVCFVLFVIVRIRGVLTMINFPAILAVYVDSWLEQIRFITTLILNADESTSL